MKLSMDEELARSSILAYRYPGHLTKRATAYLEDLRTKGHPEEDVKSLNEDLPIFESASIRGSFSLALRTMPRYPAEIHHQFLRELNEHVRLLCEAQRMENLLLLSRGKDKELALEAHRFLRQIAPAVDDDVGR